VILGRLAFGQAPLDPAQAERESDKRILGVLPNYRTADGSVPFAPIPAKQKFTIAFKDSFDYPVYFITGSFAALYQLDGQDPSWGQGLKGYGKRYAAAYGDQAIGNMMTEGVVPVLFHEDPRYFRRGSGTSGSRLRYAITRVLLSRTDKGNWGFNYAEWLGNGAAAAISNFYYPSDTRNFHDNLEKVSVSVATDAFSNILKEFWPDLKKRLHKHSAPKS